VTQSSPCSSFVIFMRKIYLKLSAIEVHGNSIYNGFKSIAYFETIELLAGRDTSRDKTIH